MPGPSFPFQPGDRFIRRINRHNRNSEGRPSRGAFIGKENRTSVFLERLLPGATIPGSFPDDHLAIFPAGWVFRLDLTKTPLTVEHTENAHFEIVGEFNIEFADYLREHADRVTLDEWSKQR